MSFWKKLRSAFTPPDASNNSQESDSANQAKKDNPEALLASLVENWKADLDTALIDLPARGIILALLRHAERLKDFIVTLPQPDGDLELINKAITKTKIFSGLSTEELPNTDGEREFVSIVQGPRPQFSKRVWEFEGFAFNTAVNARTDQPMEEHCRDAVSICQEALAYLSPPPSVLPNFIRQFTDDCQTLRLLVNSGEWNEDTSDTDIFESQTIPDEKLAPTESADKDFAELIEDLSRVADETIEREFTEGMIMTSSSLEMGSTPRLIQTIDRLLAVAPDSADVLFAKSEAHYACMDGETGKAFRKKTLSIAPDHFDANMREQHFAEWDHLFVYPGWDDGRKSLHDLMLQQQAAGNLVQIVRDGISPALAIVLPSERDDFPNHIVDSQWKPVWVDTPYGPAFEHYAMLKLGSGDIRKQELTICPYPVEPVHARHGDSLIRRFCEAENVFIVYNDGAEVLYNCRYIFPKSTLNTLQEIKHKLETLAPEEDYATRFSMAAQWYMENSSLDDIHW